MTSPSSHPCLRKGEIHDKVCGDVYLPGIALEKSSDHTRCKVLVEVTEVLEVSVGWDRYDSMTRAGVCRSILLTPICSRWWLLRWLGMWWWRMIDGF